MRTANESTESASASDFDVIIVGGALSGAASALMLLRAMPNLRILIVEKSTRLGRRVGEATVEVSAYFLMRVLGLGQHLHNFHIAKQGLRFWFANEMTSSLADCSEIGGRYLSRIPSFQVDRAVLDEEVLKLACDAGVKLLRPATVHHVVLHAGQIQEIEITAEGISQTLRSRWIIDASGVACLLARQEGWRRQNITHPTSALWARFKNVADLDGLAFADKYPAWRKECFGLRSTATNHIMGDGWWAWFIPLKVGIRVSALFLINGSSHCRKATHWRIAWSDFFPGIPPRVNCSRMPPSKMAMFTGVKTLPTQFQVQAGDGFVLVGDAAGFLDPFYSPGMDWISFTTVSAVQLILKESKRECILESIREHNRRFTLSYQRWYEALYQDKYHYMGDFELMSLAFSLDLSLYYLGVVAQPYKRGFEAFLEPLFSTPASTPFFYFMRFYNGRLARIAEARRVAHTLGRCNTGHKKLVKGFALSPGTTIPIFRALFSWLLLELREGWRSWGIATDKHAPPHQTLKPVQTEVRS